MVSIVSDGLLPAESRSIFVWAVLQGPHSVPSVNSTSQRLLSSSSTVALNVAGVSAGSDAEANNQRHSSAISRAQFTIVSGSRELELWYLQYQTVHPVRE